MTIKPPEIILPSFDQHQRYGIAAKMLRPLIKGRAPRILEVGANRSEIIEGLLPEARVYYSDLYCSASPSSRFVQADGCALPLRDESVDIVVALDVYEHIPKEKRKKFLSELRRVAKVGVLLAGPFDTEGVCAAERRMNTLYRSLNGVDHPWLVEHLEHGLPPLEETQKLLTQGALGEESFFLAAHGSLSLWERLIVSGFLGEGGDELHHYSREIDAWYAERVLDEDVSAPCYRHFLLLLKEGNSYSLPEIPDGELAPLLEELERKERSLDLLWHRIQQKRHHSESSAQLQNEAAGIRGEIAEMRKELSVIRETVLNLDRQLEALRKESHGESVALQETVGNLDRQLEARNAALREEFASRLESLESSAQSQQRGIEGLTQSLGTLAESLSIKNKLRKLFGQK